MNLDLWDNLVNVVFVNPIFFFIVLGTILAYYTIIYDIPYWVAGLFGAVFVVWLGINLVGEWILIPILIITAFILAIQIFRRVRS